jgi:hypothetical protein
MAFFSASIVTKHEEGATFVFGSWLFVADQAGDLRRELRNVTTPTTAPPTRITPRRSSNNSESDMISGLYPTRRSTWRPKRSSTPTREDMEGVVIHQDSQLAHHKSRLPTSLRIVSSEDQGVVTRVVTVIPTANNPQTTRQSKEELSKQTSRLDQGLARRDLSRFAFGLKNSASAYQRLTHQKMRSTLDIPSTQDLPLPRRTLQDLVITTTPQGAIVHWPDTDLTDLQQTGNDGFPASGTLPFQEGRELPHEASTAPFTDPSRHSLVIIGDGAAEEQEVSSDENTTDGETPTQRRDRLDHNAERRLRRRDLEARDLLPTFNEEEVFRDPMANVMSATRLLDGYANTPEIKTALTRLEAAALRIDKMGLSPSRSASRRTASTAPRRQESSHYGSSNQGARVQGGRVLGATSQGGRVQGGRVQGGRAQGGRVHGHLILGSWLWTEYSPHVK